MPVPIYESQYEELTDETEIKVRELIDAVGLPWDDACLSHAEAKSTVMTLSAWQVRQPIYKTSVKRWKRFEKHLGPLIDALGRPRRSSLSGLPGQGMRIVVPVVLLASRSRCAWTASASL